MGRRCGLNSLRARLAPCGPQRARSLLAGRGRRRAAHRRRALRARPTRRGDRAHWDCGHSAAAMAAAESSNPLGVTSSTTAAALPAAVVLEVTGVPSAAGLDVGAGVALCPPRSIHRVCSVLGWSWSPLRFASRRARPPSSVASAHWDCGHSAAAMAAAESSNPLGVTSSTTAAALPAAVVLEVTGVSSAAGLDVGAGVALCPRPLCLK